MDIQTNYTRIERVFTMKNLIKIEWSGMKWIYLLVILAGIIYSSAMVFLKLNGYSYDYNIQIWQESNEILGLIFPVFAVLPTCWSMYYERKNNYLMYTALRISKFKYIITKWLMSAIFGALVIFTISFSGLLTSLYLINTVEPSGTDYAVKSFMGFYLVHEPLMYGIALSLWRGMIGFLVATMGFILSVFSSNLFIILSGPFVYCILENFLLAILNVPYYRLVTSFSPYLLSPEAVTLGRLLVGPLILGFAIISISIYFKAVRKEKIFIV